MIRKDAIPTSSWFHRPAVFGLEAEIVVLEQKQDKYGKFHLFQVRNHPNEKLTPVFHAYMEKIIEKDFSEYLIRSGNFFHRLGMSYIDGAQIELTTPESSCPFETAENIDLQKSLLGEVLKTFNYHAYCANSSRSKTVGFHENYQSTFSSSALDMQRQCDLIPHLISRIGLVGSGGISRNGAFTLSPRLSHIDAMKSDESTLRRGIILVRSTNPCTDIGSRLQLISADHPIDIETTALLLGTTALASRLNELGLLPKTKIDWFKESTKFDYMLRGFNPDFFMQIVDYQRELLQSAKHYIAWLEENSMPDFFASKVSALALFEIWETRLNDLERFAKTRDLGPLLDWSEWANKQYTIEWMRRQNKQVRPNGISANFLSDLEIKKLLELTEINPGNLGVSRFQSLLNASPLSGTATLSCPRANLRERILKELDNHPAVIRHDLKVDASWQHIYVMDPNCRHLLKIIMESPYGGTEDDFKEICVAIDRLDRTILPEPVKICTSNVFKDFEFKAHSEAGDTSNAIAV